MVDMLLEAQCTHLLTNEPVGFSLLCFNFVVLKNVMSRRGCVCWSQFRLRLRCPVLNPPVKFGHAQVLDSIWEANFWKDEHNSQHLVDWDQDEAARNS